MYSFYNYVLKTMFDCNTDDELNGKKQREDFHESFFRQLKFFPHFPDNELITDLSREHYERKKCTATLIFLPIKNNIDDSSFVFTYGTEKIYFDDSNRRLIRKLLESLDDEHALVLEYDDNIDNYYVIGIIAISNINKFSNYYRIKISGYLNWSAECTDFKLFDYYEGKVCEYKHFSVKKDIQIDKVISLFEKAFDDVDIAILKKILNIITNQLHGTNFVVFDSDMAEKETVRLCSVGRGLAAKTVLPYEMFCECLPQFTNVDGGFIFDKKFNCYAYGCIYDGKADDTFEGSLARGSRYNSTKLYVHNFNSNGETVCCLGVVSSDDGGIECVE